MKVAAEKDGYGHRDEKGYWVPPGGAAISPFFQKPLKPLKILSFLLKWGGYLLPWNLLFAGLAFLTYFFLILRIAPANPLSLEWIAQAFLRNQILIWLMFGSLHLILIKQQRHGTDRKFNIRFMEKSKKFMFGDQVLDNIFWSCVSGGTFWTAYEVLYFWLLAGNRIPTISFNSNPVWFVLLFLLLPIYRESHFYLIHRLIHWKPLLRTVHSVHHRNPNPGPWSGLSMHPLEHLLYFSSGVIFFIIPASPVHYLFLTIANGLAPAPGHTGFDSYLFKGWLPGGDFFHFLHHRHVSCNYGTPTAPWDKIGGSFYDGNGNYQEWKKARIK
jgi:sterol desaturase/sphingolipid hydroxylase (fatty acid hydroxylase superfamily)